MGKYYAVRSGRHPGVYNSWDECKAQTDGYSGAQFKSFPTAQEAKDFVNSQPSAVARGRGVRKNHPYKQWTTSSARPVMSSLSTNSGAGVSDQRSTASRSPDRFEMYTDGACRGNGRTGARAGIGVHFPSQPDMDISEPLSGRPTNNRAEIHAAIRALQMARVLCRLKVEILTDSQFMNQAVNEWSAKWRRNNWKTADGRDVINKQDFLELEAASQGMDIKWTKVPAHSGVPGNERADQLATEGINRR